MNYLHDIQKIYHFGDVQFAMENHPYVHPRLFLLQLGSKRCHGATGLGQAWRRGCRRIVMIHLVPGWTSHPEKIRYED